MKEDKKSELDEIREKKIEELKLGGENEGGSPKEPIHLEDTEDLEKFVEKYDKVLVDFYADWCGPCKMLEPVVEEIANETDATVVKVDIDVYQGLAQEYNVRGVPTLVYFSGGEMVEKMVGVQDKSTLEGLVEKY